MFPALGHDDPILHKKLGAMWSRWLPTDSMKTFETGKYSSPLEILNYNVVLLSLVGSSQFVAIKLFYKMCQNIPQHSYSVLADM